MYKLKLQGGGRRVDEWMYQLLEISNINIAEMPYIMMY